MAQHQSEARSTHRERLDAYLARTGLASVWFTRPNNFAWLTGGSNVVDRGSATGCAAAGYDGDGVTVVTDTIEADRLREEELGADVSVVDYPWYDWTLPEMILDAASTPAAADVAVGDLDRVTGAVLRRPLADADVTAYRSLGEETAAAVEAVCREATPESTERELVGRLRDRLSSRGIDAPVALVGGERRAPRYRHYTPTDATIGGYALVSVTASRDGLFASTTRTVAFDPPDWLERRSRATARIQTTALEATRSVGSRGGTAADVFATIRSAYDEVGWPEEWRRHHQGGATGYAGREWFATPTADDPVSLPMAYAWNPTIEGAKSEDTWLVTEDGFERLTATDDWATEPTRSMDGRLELDQPVIFDRR